MRSIVTDRVAWFVCRSVCHDREPCNKSSAVADMGDHFATIDMGRGLRTQAAVPASVNCEPYVAAVVPLSVGELSPHLTQCRLDRGLPLYQVVS